MSGTMKLFQHLETVFQAITVLPSGQNQRRTIFLKRLFYFSSMVLYVIGSLAFFMFKARLISEYCDSFYLLSTEIATTCYLVIYIRTMPKISAFLDHLNALFQEKLNDPHSRTSALELHEKIEKFTKLVDLAFTKITLAGILISAVVLTLVNYFVFDLGDESYLLASPISTPFNWRTPFGYVVALLVESAGFYSATLIGIPCHCLFVGSCYAMTFLVECITKDVANLEMDSSLDAQKDKTYLYAYRKFRAHFYDISQRISETKGLVYEFISLYEFLVTIPFLWTLSDISCSLLKLNIDLKSSGYIANPMEFARTLGLLFWSFAIILLSCYFGEMVTTQFESFNNELDKCIWYTFPKDFQKMFVIVLQNAQKPVVIYGFGNVFCMRDTMKKTVKASFSYFMALRQFS